ncbi:RiPP maturation radical SAM C-methyltransferase [Streptomyces antioxidans]|uniref:RiPP maturation radical SAM C-methyltransferase n=1 Tax=Streptomyces antioxidans TaxID=1507734 RepID=UPI00099DB910|nr:RiPP maturation radical SAM C-methyltransferase [Streptomyces antioxidans]
MRVLLINMPWAPLETPSLALGILKRAAAEKVPGTQAEVLHANLEYIDWITSRTEFTREEYDYYALSSYFLGCGDWVFSSALYDDPEWKNEEFTEAMREELSESRMALTHELHASAPEFIEELAERVVAEAPDVVGFTSSYQQNVAALAAAKHIKRLAPETVVVMGGANCDAEQGAAAHRNFPFVDYVVRGEGDVAFVRLLTALRDGATPTAIPGLCWRKADGTSVATPMSTVPLPPGAILMPDHGGYFERFAASAARNWTEPLLVVEGARGCWWGEKHHCTFCGLNGSFMEFRSKSPDTFYDEIISLAREHQVLDMYVVDNILDMGYLTSLVPRLTESGYDLRLRVEIKANMRRSQLRALAEAGIIHVQPGIESLNSRVLGLMDKGVSGCQNVRMLRDAAEVGLSVAWNYLRGFPGERDQDYDPIIEQIPAVEHLTPSAEASSPITIERFSPYFNRPELGFSQLRAKKHYRFTYDLPEEELYDLAYIFESQPQGIGEETAQRLDDALQTWRDVHPASRLTHLDLDDRIVLVNQRRAFDWNTLELTEPLEIAAFRLLDRPRTPAALIRDLARNFPERPAAEKTLENTVSDLLKHWLRLGLVFTDGGQYIHIAPRAVNGELLRLNVERRPDHWEVSDDAEAEEGTGPRLAAALAYDGP